MYISKEGKVPSTESSKLKKLLSFSNIVHILIVFIVTGNTVVALDFTAREHVNLPYTESDPCVGNL